MTDVEPIADDLLQRWHHHVSPDRSLFDRLVARHRERQRSYHRIEHVAAVVALVEDLSLHEPCNDVSAVIAAAFYHDAIYEPTHPANERASARLAQRDLERLGWAAERRAAVGAMIQGTTGHRDPVDMDTAVLFDADLAVLGADPPDYERYVGQVRREYRHLDDAEWTTGRSRVLHEFLARDALFATDTGRGRWQHAAHRNLRDELDGLRTEPTPTPS